MKDKMRLRIKAVTILVCFLATYILAQIKPISVLADEDTSYEDVYEDQEMQNICDMFTGDMPVLSEEESGAEEESMIFEYVDEEKFNASGHKRRATELEDLNTYVFDNVDGTRSIYYMHENVKYIDKHGKVKEKNISLKKKSGGYGIVENCFELSIPDNPVNGIAIGYLGYDIRLIPQGTTTAVTTYQDDNTVVYRGVYGKNTRLKYTPLLSGIKEDIVLTEYTPDASYDFILETDGLNIYNENDRYYLSKNKKNSPIFYLGDILIYDAVGKPDIGTMKVETIKQGKQYLLTIIANDEFLSDPDTVYPVTIDPSITVSDSSTNGAIIDAPIFKGYPGSNFGNFVYDRVGTPSASYGVGRTVVKLAGLISQNEYKTINANQISSVTFNVREASGTAAQYVNLYPLTGNTTWSETSVTWNNAGAYTTDVNYGATMSSNQWTSFNITALVKDWKNGKYYSNASFILINSDETKDKCFLSSEYSTAAYRPYVVMTYSPSISINYSTTSITEGGTKTLIATTRPSGQTVTWSTSNSAIATVSSTGVVTAKKAGMATIIASMTRTDGVVQRAVCTVFVTIPNGVYYIQNNNSNLRLQVYDGKINNHTNVYQFSKYDDTVNDSQRVRQMWKIYHIGNGRYSIRPMHKLDMGLNVASGNVDIYNIGTTDTLSSVPLDRQWTIEWDSKGYVFKNKAQSNLTMQVSGQSTALSASVVAAGYADSANCRWRLTKIAAPPTGILLYNTVTGNRTNNPVKTINPKESLTMSQACLAVAVYSGSTNSQNVVWVSSNPAVATVDVNTGSITGVSNGTVTITARKYIVNAYYYASFTVKVNNNAIIIVPGILGTELVAGPNNGEFKPGEKLWGKEVLDEFDSDSKGKINAINKVLTLICDNNGNSFYDVVPYDNLYGALDTYKYLYDFLRNTYGEEHSVRFFAYDWRMSNAVSAEKLDEYIRSNNFDNVTLVCHSMGGLVASGYLALGTQQRNKVKTLIAIGTPFLGASIVPYLWGSEDLPGLFDMGQSGLAVALRIWFALDNPIDEVVSNFVSLYELFPTEMYFDSAYAGRNYFLYRSLITLNYVNTYSLTENLLEINLPEYKPKFVESAKAFHRSLYVNGEHITSLVNSYYIAGEGEKTVDKVLLDGGFWYAYSTTDSGDGVVATWSATLGDRYANRTHYVSESYHVDFISYSNVTDLVRRMINGEL